MDREGPWHNPHEVFPDSTPKIVQKHLDALPDYVVDRGTGKICLTFQSFLLRTPHHNILIDTCVGNHSTRRKGLLYPKDRWLTEFHGAGVTFENIDYVFHLSALADIVPSIEKPHTYFQSNVNGTFNVMEACLKNKVKKLIYSSSASVYGDALYEPIDEMHPFNNKNFYGATKIACEAMLTSYHYR